jgi:signal transduction histidine kinase
MIFQWQLMQGFYFDQQAQQMAANAQQLASMIESAQSSDEVEQQVSMISRFLNAGITILSRDDLVQGQSGSMMGMMNGRGHNPAMLSRRDYSQLLSGNTVVYKSNMPMRYTENIVAATPILIEQQIAGAVVMHVPAETLLSVVSVINMRTLWLAVILMFIAMLFALWLSNYISRPLTAMRNATLDIAAGHFSKKVNIKGEDELGQLASAINYMSSELAKLDQMRRDLIANVSHELRTPLSLIRGYSEALKDGVVTDTEQQKQYVDIILDETARLQKLVSDLLDLSQLESGSLSINPHPFSISRCIHEICRRFEAAAAKNQIGLTASADDNIIVHADEGRIEQVLYNLIQNAINHTPPQGRIIVSAEKHDGKAFIQVSDTGRGISPDDLPHIFDKFYRGEHNRKGTGLGLTIARGILTAHGSDITVKSQPNQSTTFAFYLPLYREVA